MSDQGDLLQARVIPDDLTDLGRKPVAARVHPLERLEEAAAPAGVQQGGVLGLPEGGPAQHADQVLPVPRSTEQPVDKDEQVALGRCPPEQPLSLLLGGRGLPAGCNVGAAKDRAELEWARPPTSGLSAPSPLLLMLNRPMTLSSAWLAAWEAALRSDATDTFEAGLPDPCESLILRSNPICLCGRRSWNRMRGQVGGEEREAHHPLPKLPTRERQDSRQCPYAMPPIPTISWRSSPGLAP